MPGKGRAKYNEAMFHCLAPDDASASEPHALEPKIRAMLAEHEEMRVDPLINEFLVLSARIHKGLRVDGQSIVEIASFLRVSPSLVRQAIAELCIPASGSGYVDGGKFHAAILAAPERGRR